MTRFSILLVLLSVAGLAAERHWQTGTWRDMTTRRKMIDFGPGSSGFGRPGAAPPGPSMRAMADVRTFVIDTDDLVLDLEDTVPIGRRSIDVVIGAAVTFAVEKNAVYIRDASGAEHKLRLVKKTARARAAPAAPATKVTPATPTTVTTAYTALGGGHFIRAVSGDGRYVTLEDGSRWEIAPKDWYQTVDWEATENVTVRTFPQPENGFGYELTNTTMDEGVAASYVPSR